MSISSTPPPLPPDPIRVTRSAASPGKRTESSRPVDTPVPVQEDETAVRDRIELSTELGDRMQRFREQMVEENELTAQRINEIRREMQEARDHTHRVIVRTALGILDPMSADLGRL